MDAPSRPACPRDARAHGRRDQADLRRYRGPPLGAFFGQSPHSLRVTSTDRTRPPHQTGPRREVHRGPRDRRPPRSTRAAHPMRHRDPIPVAPADPGRQTTALLPLPHPSRKSPPNLRHTVPQLRRRYRRRPHVPAEAGRAQKGAASTAVPQGRVQGLLPMRTLAPLRPRMVRPAASLAPRPPSGRLAHRGK